MLRRSNCNIKEHDYKFIDTYKSHIRGDRNLYGISILLPCTNDLVFYCCRHYKSWESSTSEEGF